MAEEIKNEIKEEGKCDKKELKRFLLTVLGSFLGCLVALCLYNAATRPQLPPPPIQGPFPIQKFEHKKFNHHPDFRGQRPNMPPQFRGEEEHKKFNGDFKPQLPKDND